MNKTKQRSASHIQIIQPRKGWIPIDLRELYEFRELFYILVQRDIKVRYRQTLLGILWAVIQPMMTMVVFSIFFGHFAKMPSDGYPYPVFVYAGLLPWTFFANGIFASGNCLVGNSHLITKIYFPRLILPMVSLGVGLVDLFISFCIFIIMLICFGVGLSPGILLTPFLLFFTIMTVLGTGLILSAMSVVFRDFRHIIPYLVQLWMFVSPVVYPVSILPNWKWIWALNPMTGLIDGYRSAFLGKDFDWPLIGLSATVSTVMFIFGLFYFKRTERRFADVI